MTFLVDLREPNVAVDVSPKKRGKKARPPGHIRVHKTAIFKLHNPSKHKRAMLKDAMQRAHLAYSHLLSRFLPEIERLAALTKKERNRELQDRTYPFLCGRPLGGAAKAGVRVDLAGALNSYLELRQKQEAAQPPTAAPINDQRSRFLEVLEELSRLANDLKQQNILGDELRRAARPGRLRPINYYGNTKDFFLLLRKPQEERYYAWLNLHPQTSRFAAPVTVKDLVDIRTGEVVSFTSKTGALFPLEMGHAFQNLRFIQKGKPQSARLVWRTERNGEPCDEFEIHVTFEWLVPQQPTALWLGVDRGVYNLAAYAAVTDAGAIIETGAISGRGLRHRQIVEERRLAVMQRRGHKLKWRKRRAWADEAVHVTANKIVEVATRHGARVVVEDLAGLSGVRRRKRVPGTRRSSFNRLLGRVQYEKLRKVLKYKLGEVGLPVPLAVHAARTSQTCPECAHQAPENRPKQAINGGFKMDRFACVRCGYAADADENAARVIALKGKWLTTLPRKHEREAGMLANEPDFVTFVGNSAERRRKEK